MVVRNPILLFVMDRAAKEVKVTKVTKGIRVTKVIKVTKGKGIKVTKDTKRLSLVGNAKMSRVTLGYII
jgi:hypothetical protein